MRASGAGELRSGKGLLRDGMKLAGHQIGTTPTTSRTGEVFHRQESRQPCVSTRRALIGPSLLGLLAACGLLVSACREAPEEPLSPESREASVSAEAELAAPQASAPTQPADALADSPRPLRDPARFRGEGSLRGHLRLPGRLPAPTGWIVEVEPSRTLPGSEFAIKVRLDLPGSATEFEMGGLPLGGYDLRVRAPGYASPAQPVLLQRGSANPYVQVALAPLGTVHGLLVDTEGTPVTGAPLHLRLRRSGEVFHAETRADGSWFFEDIEPAAWTLITGPLELPWIDPVHFDNVGARSANLGEQRVPMTGTFKIQVTDAFQVGVPGAQVVGYSMRGGSFDLTADNEGHVTVPFLTLGEWTLMASDGTERRARAKLTLTDSRPTPVYLTLQD